MSSHDEAIANLELFNAKAARLDRTRFRAWLDQAKLGWSFRKDQDGEDWRVTWDSFDDDDADALVCTLRMFLQNNDRISLGRIGDLYERLPMSASLRDRAWLNRAVFNKYYAAKSPLISRDRHYTRREVVDMVVYGTRAHTNPKWSAEVGPWLRDPGLRAMLETEFAEIVEEILRYIHAVRRSNELAIEELRAGTLVAASKST